MLLIYIPEAVICDVWLRFHNHRLRAFRRGLNIRQRRHESHGLQGRDFEADREIGGFGFRRNRVDEGRAAERDRKVT
jgi:hypothetical protein